VNRVQKVLEGANIKLVSVASDVLGVTGRAMLEEENQVCIKKGRFLRHACFISMELICWAFSGRPSTYYQQPYILPPPNGRSHTGKPTASNATTNTKSVRQQQPQPSIINSYSYEDGF
jgi:hypothetical protein